VKDNHLYEKHRNRYLTDPAILKLVKHDMTYILGARCCDGVVLVGDTKITIDEGSDYAYGKKITRPFPNGNVVMGASGIGGLYKDFSNRVVSTIIEMDAHKEEYSPIVTEEQFGVLVNKVIREMHTDYDKDRHMILNNLMVICASRINGQTAVLTIFNPYGFPEPVDKARVIGHGEPYGALFLKKMWNPRMTMEETAKLGIFVIKFIEDMKIDNSVGFNEEFLPQVYCVPDIIYPKRALNPSKRKIQEMLEKYPIRELSPDDVKYYINEVSSKISDFENLFKQGKFKL